MEDATLSKINTPIKERASQPTEFRVLQFNADAFLEASTNVLARSELGIGNNIILEFPLPNGKKGQFELVDAELMHPNLAAKFPELKAYLGKGINDPTALIRVTYSPYFGLSGMILSGKHSTVYIDPMTQDNQYYMAYYREDLPLSDSDFTCLTDENTFFKPEIIEEDERGPALGDCNLRRYRLALSSTGEYSQYHINAAGGSTGSDANDKAIVQAAMNVTMNRVNGVYERDLGITLQFVPNNDIVIYLNAGSDPWTGEYSTRTAQTLDSQIGVNNYDIGHNFNTSGGGSAGCIDCVCLAISQNGTHKGRGYTGLSAPIGDPFDIDYVAHEMGHQFGGFHTQSNQSCRSGDGSTEVEPGSASTIMGYAGICSANIQNNSDDYFAYVNIRDIVTSINGGNGSGCAELISSGNAGPNAAAIPNYSIPTSTPFKLEGMATDADDAGLTYCWEQNDPENPGSNAAPSPTRTAGPMFRSLDPVAVPYRYMPNLNAIINNNNPTWEVLPSVERSMEFSFTVRDNNPNSGCTASSLMTVTTVDGGPFLVTAPNTAVVWDVGTTQTVTWDVAGTTAAPVSCANVDILLSIDGGMTYPITLASAVTNDGSHDISVPNNPATTCRVMVACSDNIFFDISNQNFEIQFTGPGFLVNADPAQNSACQPNDATYTIDVSGFGGYSDDVSLVATSLPAGAVATFTPNNVTGGSGSATLTITSSGVSPGFYDINVEATGSVGTEIVSIELDVLTGAPGNTSLVSPTDAATDVSTQAALSWNVAPEATAYNLEVATDMAFASVVDNQTGISGTSTTASGLSTNTQYYWRVQAANLCGTSAWSAVRSFTTQDIAPCPSYDAGPFGQLNPLPSACFNECTPSVLPFQVWQNEAYIVYDMVGGETYTFDICDG